jgi:hypothetical protein
MVFLSLFIANFARKKICMLCSVKSPHIFSMSTESCELVLVFWHVALFIQSTQDYGFGYLKKEVYQRVGEEIHSIKMVRMETSSKAACSY